jgi:LCP family protein required for cell wall assembly
VARRVSSTRAFAGRCGVALTITTILMVVAVFMANYVFDLKFNSIAKEKIHNTVKSNAEGANFLLIGSDTRAFVKDATDATSFGNQGQAGGQRSDTLMVVHVEPKTERALVVSFPRDLFVQVDTADRNACIVIKDGKCMAKINSAFNTGPDLVIKTLKENFNIDINHYIEINFKSFEGIVDAIGTVPVYFPYPARDAKTGLYTPTPGCHLLDGKGALAYARARDLEYYSYPRESWVKAEVTPDVDRIKRQQDFMKRLATIAVQRSLGDPFTANSVVDAVLANLKVDSGLSKDDLLSFIDVFRNVNPTDSTHVDFEVFPWTNGPFQGNPPLSVLYPSEPAADAMLARLRDFSGGATPTSATTTTTAPSTSSTAPGTVTTTTTVTTPAPVANKGQLGDPAVRTPPC